MTNEKNYSLIDTLHQLAEEPTLSTKLLAQLSHLDGGEVTTVREAWVELPPTRRQQIVQAVVELAEDNFDYTFEPLFVLCLNDSQAEVRTQAIHGLWVTDSIKLIEPFLHRLTQDPSPEVQAATGLGKYLYLAETEQIASHYGATIKQALYDQLTQLTRPADLEPRRRVIEALAYSSDEAVTQIIQRAYADSSELMQASAIFAMGRNADARWMRYVLQELDNPLASLRYEAARACGALEIRDSVAQLAQLLNEDDDIEVQQMAIWALGQIGGSVSREILEDCSAGENDILAEAADEALEELNMFSDNMGLFDFDEFDDDDLLEPDFV